MLHMTKETGGYALGSGNSIPDYVPLENYKALLRAALEE
jgi:uroporphyrinogen decarboxylase